MADLACPLCHSGTRQGLRGHAPDCPRKAATYQSEPPCENPTDKGTYSLRCGACPACGQRDIERGEELAQDHGWD